MKKTISLLVVLLIAASLLPLLAYAEEPVTIEYWQYFYESKVNFIDELIGEFEAANPDIKVVHQTFPYDSYQEKLAAAIAAGEGPSIVNLFYGWVPKYVKSGVLQELPKTSFAPEMIESEFAPMVQINKFDGKYYTIPIAVRTLGLLYNKDILAKNGFDAPPSTLEEMLDMAIACTERDANGTLQVEGLTFQPTGQLHTYFRPVLLEQFGQPAMSPDYKEVLWNKSEGGYQAFEWLVDLVRKHGVGENNFMTDDVTAFRQGAAAMSIDGSFRLGTLAGDTELNYGVAKLPTYNGIEKSFSSFWTNGILAGVEGKELEAAEKFLSFLTSEDVMKRWTLQIGEIGARVSIADDEELLANENLAPFIEMLPNATSYFYVDEAADRQVVVDAIDMVLVGGMDPRDALDASVEAAQAILDAYWND